MTRKRPGRHLAGKPCMITALRCVCDEPVGKPVMKDGYTTLNAANTWIRQNLKVQKRINYRRGERPKLRDLHLDGRGIVCVVGHYIYVDHETYWSFFNNDNDEVVTVWILK